jgi:hypothetical protein
MLFDLRSDPGEIHDLAFEARYRPILDTLRNKLQDVVLGDGRIEVKWSKDGGEVLSTTPVTGADDGKITIPELASKATE